MKEIRIRPVLNGFIVTVGCSEVVFTDVDFMFFELKRYQKDPQQVEKEYQEKAINKNHGVPEIAGAAREEEPTLGTGTLLDREIRGVNRERR
jgi:hypothetical protein